MNAIAIREHEAEAEHLALPARPFRAGERSQATRARQPADHPWHHGVGDEAVEATVAQRVVRQWDRPVGDERRDARAHRCERLGEPPHADQAYEEGQECEQRVQQRHVAEHRDRAQRDERERGGRCGGRAHPDHAPTRAERPHQVGRRRRQRRELPDGGHSVCEQLATSYEQERDRDDPGHEGGAARPRGERVRDAASHGRRGCKPLLGGRPSHRGSDLRAAPRLQVPDLVVGHEPNAVEIAAATPDAAVVREVPRPRAERALRSTRVSGEERGDRRRDREDRDLREDADQVEHPVAGEHGAQAMPSEQSSTIVVARRPALRAPRGARACRG